MTLTPSCMEQRRRCLVGATLVVGPGLFVNSERDGTSPSPTVLRKAPLVGHRDPIPTCRYSNVPCHGMIESLR